MPPVGSIVGERSAQRSAEDGEVFRVVKFVKKRTFRKTCPRLRGAGGFELREQLRLEFEPARGLGRRAETRDLDRDAPPRLGLLRLVDDAHPAVSEFADDLEVADLLSPGRGGRDGPRFEIPSRWFLGIF